MNKSLNQLLVYGAVMSCCFCVLSVLPCRGEDKPTRATNNLTTVIPAIAQISNVQLRVTRMEQFEVILGNGRAPTRSRNGPEENTASSLRPGGKQSVAEWNLIFSA